MLAQIVAAQVRAEERQAEMADAMAQMQQALTALAHEQMQARAEAARMQRRLQQVETDLRETEVGGDEDDCPG